jgi:hypothetical protein
MGSINLTGLDTQRKRERERAWGKQIRNGEVTSSYKVEHGRMREKTEDPLGTFSLVFALLSVSTFQL